MRRFILILCCVFAGLFAGNAPEPQEAQTEGFPVITGFPIVSTNQRACYDTFREIAPPKPGQPFYGQDAQFSRNEPSYRDNGDGTVTDLVTGLIWQKSADLDGDGDIDYDDKLTFEEAVTYADTCTLAGQTDWRLPDIKALYSLILFSGRDPSGLKTAEPSVLQPFIDTRYFDFGYGDTRAGERIIDAQYVSSTKYVSTTMNGQPTVFGVNFADGRIKGYGIGPRRGPRGEKRFYIKLVRGNPEYGKNHFVDNGDGTITDLATGLMWTKEDSKQSMNWRDALQWVQQKNQEKHLGYDDWRLPDIKELQSIVDYSRAPAATQSPAIDTLFVCTSIIDESGNPNYPYYWSSTTHANMRGGHFAAYIAFGEGLGWMEMPPFSGNHVLLDVHGAGCQRSDPKTGDPHSYPYGHGPQGDVVRIFNFVRLVRYVEGSAGAIK